MSLRRSVVIVIGALVGAAAAAPGQGGWTGPGSACDVKAGHPLVQGGVQYLKAASETRFEDRRQTNLKDAHRVLTQALSTGGQRENPAPWYYLGRYYEMTKDVAGADSAFRRAEQLKPSCKDDIAVWRRSLWMPIFNGGVAAWQAGNTDSATASFRRANSVYDGEPNGFLYLATLYANAGQLDSATTYFEKGIAIAARDPKFAQQRREATFNLARIYHRAGQWDKAEAGYRSYLELVPGDLEALGGLAVAYANTGRRDSALALYRSILERADSLDANALFLAGVGIFRLAPGLPDTADAGRRCRSEARSASPPPSARRIAARCDSVTAGMMGTYKAGSTEAFTLAARAFDAGLAKNPYQRDGLYNLTNTYLALNDSAKMLPAAQRLYAVDPLSRTAAGLVAQAWSFRGRSDSTLRYLVLRDSLLAVDVEVSSFEPQEQGASLGGRATNFHRKGSAPLKLTVEFMDAQGQVVAPQTVDVPALAAGAVHTFDVQATGRGIVAWRYKKG